ncbi:hypothetical protein, partial [Peribacillus deserti]|uniref:hypothetical protein n=1 Tax=Peribacillus deserti TaxID=673318 RepID=UPI001C61086F
MNFVLFLAVFANFVVIEQGVISTTGCSLSAGRALSLLSFACGVSPVPLLPQESRTLRSNQP